MSIQDAARIFKTLGLNWRVPLFHDLAHELASRHGRLKRTEKQLQRLPGVGVQPLEKFQRIAKLANQR